MNDRLVEEFEASGKDTYEEFAKDDAEKFLEDALPYASSKEELVQDLVVAYDIPQELAESIVDGFGELHPSLE